MAHGEEERKALGRDLAQARKDAGFTMQSAAEELTRRGFPILKQTIGAWEIGRNLPDALWLRRLARVYRTSIDVLTGDQQRTEWPLSPDLYTRVVALSGDDLYKLERAMRAHLDMPHISASDFANIAQMDTGAKPAYPYHRAPEEGSGLPEHITPLEPKRDGSSTKDRRRAHPKGGRGA